MISRFLAATVAIIFLSGAAWTFAGDGAPSLDMLEYLGSFETAGGKGIDPLLLEDANGAHPTGRKPASKNGTLEKPATKKLAPKSEEENDE